MIGKLILLFKHTRPKNLLIVAATQLAVFFLIIKPILNNSEAVGMLSPLLLLLLVLDTVLLAAGGYLINDISDDEIDRINKGLEFSIIHNLGKNFATVAYWSLGLLGLVISAFLAWKTDLWNLFWLYPLTWILLFLYAKIFKKTPLFGNLLVSLFCAFVPGLMLIAEWPAIFKITSGREPITTSVAIVVLLLYILFAFLSTMIREIIKDMEDIEGDRQHGCRTLPIVWGKGKSKIVILLFSLMLIFSLSYFASSMIQLRQWYTFHWIVFGILLPMLVILFYLYRAVHKSDFGQLSTWMKYLMLSGLLLLVVVRWEML